VTEPPFVDPDPTEAGDTPDADAWERLQSLPSQDDDPVRWEHVKGFVPNDPTAGRPGAEGSGGRWARGGGDLPAGAVPVIRLDPPASVDDRTAVLSPSPPPPAAPPSAPPPIVPPRRAARSVTATSNRRPGPETRTPPPGSRPPAPPRRAGRRRGRGPARWARRVVVSSVVMLLVLVGLPLGFAWVQFQKIERVEVATVLSPGGGSGTNYLIVGSDSRDNIDADAPNSDAFLGTPVAGERADTIIVLRVGDGDASMLSIPRDLWVTNAETGEVGRINATYANGPDALIRTVQGLGIPVHHYLEIDFTSFAGLVDAVGGITIEVPHPATDHQSGLLIPEAGVVTLDGDQALAYVRSRSYMELIDGQWRTDPTGDLGRVERQRVFLTSLLSAVGGVRNPNTLRQVASSLAPGLRIDDELGFFAAARLGWNLKGLSPASVDLPVVPRTTSGGAAVLELSQPDAATVISDFSG